jgi:hypothetical protein
MPDHLDDTITRMRPISLEELDASAALWRRADTK